MVALDRNAGLRVLPFRPDLAIALPDRTHPTCGTSSGSARHTSYQEYGIHLNTLTTSRVVAALIFVLSSGIALGAPAEQQSTLVEGDPARSTSPVAARFAARKEPVEQLFKAIGSEMKKAFQVSAKARTYRISGEFDLEQPFETLERVSASLGLIWYYDGQVVYVYDGSESTSVMLQLPADTVNGLITFLKSASLYDHRFPLKHSSADTGLIYLSAPPKYVEIVQSAAAMLQNQEPAVQEDGRRVEVVRLRHAFVSNRSVRRRDTTEIVPGLAHVLSQVMSRQVSVDPASFTESGSTSIRSNSSYDFSSDLSVGRPLLPSGLAGDRPYLPNDAAGGRPLLPHAMASSPGGDVRLPQSGGATLEGFAWAARAPSRAAEGFASAARAPSRAAEGFAWAARRPYGSADAQAPGEPLRDGSSTPIRIVAYANTNSLLLEGSPQQIAMAKRIIAQLDIPKEQVELSLWVIDVQKQAADELGAQWAAGGKLGPVEVGFNSSVFSQGATLSRSDTMKFLASVTALARQSRARIVSRPILLAQDNSPAVFDNSKSFYVRLEGERIASLQKVTYGTMINVLPHVVDGRGRIEMELSVEDGYSAAASPDLRLDLPIVSSTSISTMARVQHQQSLLIGGYTLNERTEGSSKIPLLGDIPLLGQLFTFQKDSDVQSVRLFLIQPRLLAEDGDFDPHSVNTPPRIDNAVDALRAQLGKPHGQ